MITKIALLYLLGLIYAKTKKSTLIWDIYKSWIIIGIVYGLSLLAGDIGLAVALTLILILATKEAAEVAKLDKIYKLAFPSIIIASVILASLNTDSLTILPFCYLATFGLITLIRNGAHQDLSQTLIANCIAIWIVFPLLHLIFLHKMDSTNTLVTFIIVATSLSDIGAFIFGNFINKKLPKHHLIAQNISPNKSWEGTIGNLTGAAIASLLFFNELQPYIRPTHLIVITLVLAAASVSGDMLESMYKRYFNVKDSGNLLPGLGGVLDRVDSLTISSVVFYYYLAVIAPMT